MKRFVRADIISVLVCAALAAAVASCTWMPENQSINDAALTFRFARTKAGELPDTSGFILRVIRSGAEEPEYEGPYGQRPDVLKVPSGTYEASVYSSRFTAPAFDTPVYGDEKVVVAHSGETLAVSFLCTPRNSGIRIDFSDRFKARYPGKVVLRQAQGQLDYSYAERRTAWLFPGEVQFCYNDGKAENVLLRRTLEAGELLHIELDATSGETGSSFSIALDTTLVRREEQIVVGQDSGHDGLTLATAIRASELATADCVGDTVWVQGYIVGGLTADGVIDFACDTAVTGTALVIADRADCRTPAECAVLRLTKSAHKQALGLDSPANKAAIFHRKIYTQGKATTYKGYPALTNLCTYQME